MHMHSHSIPSLIHPPPSALFSIRPFLPSIHFPYTLFRLILFDLHFRSTGPVSRIKNGLIIHQTVGDLPFQYLGFEWTAPSSLLI